MGTAISKPLIVDRYAIYDRIAAGGMATVHFGRLIGEGGFSRIVAIKRLHAHFALDPDFVTMFLDEARLAARVRHPNVMPTLDVVARDSEVFLVMEYVEGEPLSNLFRAAHDRGERMPMGYIGGLMAGVLEGLHAAHNAKDDRGQPLHIVHRDISPHNVLVGVDGIPRVIDFGVAKALGQVHTTREGQIRGKLAYMSPEQILAKTVDARTDIFAASAVLWEALTGRKLFKADNDAAIMNLVLSAPIQPPSVYAPDLPYGVDAVVMRGLERDPSRRYSSADEMAAALSEVLPAAPFRKVGAWVQEVGGQKLADRADLVRDIERLSASGSSVAARPQHGEPAPVSSASGVRSGRGEPVPLSRRDPYPEDRIKTAIMDPPPAARVPESSASPPSTASGSSGSASYPSASSPSATVEPSHGATRGAVTSPSLPPGASTPRRLLPALVGAAVGVCLLYAAIIAMQSSQIVAAPPAPDFQAAGSDPPSAAPAAPTPMAAPTTLVATPTPVVPSTSASAAPRPSAAPPASTAPTGRSPATSEDAPPPRSHTHSSPPAPTSSAKIFSRY